MPPGEIRLFNVEDAIALLKKTEEVILSYCSKPWLAEAICRKYFPSASNHAVIFPVNNIDQPSFGDYSEKEIILNTLPYHFEINSDGMFKGRYKDAIFLNLVLEVISKAWAVDIEHLINAEWLRKSNDDLCVHLKKSDFAATR